jgi:hypothetical protein
MSRTQVQPGPERDERDRDPNDSRASCRVSIQTLYKALRGPAYYFGFHLGTECPSFPTSDDLQGNCQKSICHITCHDILFWHLGFLRPSCRMSRIFGLGPRSHGCLLFDFIIAVQSCEFTEHNRATTRTTLFDRLDLDSSGTDIHLNTPSNNS